MSLKLLLFGNEKLMNNVIDQLRGGKKISETQQVNVQTLNVLGRDYLIFSIPDRGLIASQSTGTNGLIFFLDPSIPLYQQKQFLFDLLQQKKQFDSLPIIITFQKDQQITIKDVINYFQLFKVKDRPSMIKQISLQQIDTITDIFKWITNQIDFRKSKTFDAQPKVVKMKSKYRQSDLEHTDNKYDTLMKDQNFKKLPVKQQQQSYVVKQKQRIKDQNMKAQLDNFNKNKKKMAPYDVKPTPNPKIQANLNFFLKDPKNQKQPQVNIKIQTDQFKPRPKQKPYVPKKTGINIATQIQDNQLFDFNKEVIPILNILTSKALETATLQIEEEQQFFKMTKYKNTYNEKVKKQKNHEQKNIQQQRYLIAEKNKLLEKYKHKDQIKKNISKRVMGYQLSNRFLQEIYCKAGINIYNRNYYKDDLDNQLKSQYLDNLMELTAKSYAKIIQKQQILQGLFQKQCIEPLINKSKIPKQQNNKKKDQKLKRRTNKLNNQRYIYIYYDHPDIKNFSSFTKYLPKYFDGTLDQFVKVKEQQLQQCQDKIQSGEFGDQDLHRLKNIQNQEHQKHHSSFIVNADNKICFQVTTNRYEQTKQQLLIPGIITINRQLDAIFIKVIQSSNSLPQFLSHTNDLRFKKDLVNMDQGLILDLKKIPNEIRAIILFTKIPNINNFIKQGGANKFKYSSYGLELFERAVSIQREDIGQKIKWEEIVKPPAEGQEPVLENSYNICYLLTRKFDMESWFIEDINYLSKPVNTQQEDDYLNQLSKFYKESVIILKNQEEEEVTRPVSSKKISSRGNKRTKSKKVIEQEEAAKKKQALSQVISRILNGVLIDLNNDFKQAFEHLQNSVKQWKQFIEFCGEVGWELKTKTGIKLQSIQDLKQYSKIGDILLSKVIPKVQQIIEKKQQQQNGQDGNPDD